MSLINCVECGKEVSDKAASCPNCGFPMAQNGIVKIKIPNNIVDGWVGLLSSRECIIKDSNRNILWRGQHGETASFLLQHITDIVIELGSWGNPVSGKIEPNKKYSLVQDLGVHMLATYRLSEVDVIDSD